jgi:hypothetical protein
MANDASTGSRNPPAEDQIHIEDCVNATCPWSGLPVSPSSLTRYRGAVVGFCNPGCRDKFELARDAFDLCIDGDKKD